MITAGYSTKAVTQLREPSENKCISCGRTDKEVALIPIKYQGQDKWICVKCLPTLIHG
jgi:hypothetical protein